MCIKTPYPLWGFPQGLFFLDKNPISVVGLPAGAFFSIKSAYFMKIGVYLCIFVYIIYIYIYGSRTLILFSLQFKISGPPGRTQFNGLILYMH